jgi:hypothetical protein
MLLCVSADGLQFAHSYDETAASCFIAKGNALGYACLDRVDSLCCMPDTHMCQET